MAGEGERIKRTSETPYGSVQETNSLARAGRPAPVATQTPQTTGALPGQVLSEIEQAIFAPTRRPNEPLTAGAPFGAGPNATSRMSVKQVALETVRRIASNPEAPDEVRRLLLKMEAGA